MNDQASRDKLLAELNVLNIKDDKARTPDGP